MKLAVWLKKNRYTKKAFSQEMGICREHLHSIIKGEGSRISLIQKIIYFTKGEVTVYDLYPQLMYNPRLSIEDVAIGE